MGKACQWQTSMVPVVERVPEQSNKEVMGALAELKEMVTLLAGRVQGLERTTASQNATVDTIVPLFLIPESGT